MVVVDVAVADIGAIAESGAMVVESVVIVAESADMVVVVVVSDSVFCDEQAVFRATSDSIKKADFKMVFIRMLMFDGLMSSAIAFYTPDRKR